MSNKFTGKNNTNGLKNLFYKRNNYYANAMSEDTDGDGSLDSRTSGVVDNNAFEFVYYGKIDNNLNSVWLDSSFLKYGANNAVHGLDCAVDCFEGFRNDMKTILFLSTNQDGYVFDDPYLSDIKCFKSFGMSNQSMYDNYISNLSSKFSNSLINNKTYNSIADFKSFVNTFLSFFKKNGRTEPITKTGWQKSSKSSVFSTGLYFSVANLNGGNDEEKSTFINSKNFNLYKQLAMDWGFSISLQCPWIMIWNPLSTSYKIQDILINNNIYNNNTLYKIKYNKLYITDINNLKIKLITMFNDFVENFPIKKTLSPCKFNKVNKCVEVRKALTINDFYSHISDYELINLYIEIRNIEEGNEFGPAEIARIKQKANFYYFNVDKPNATGYNNCVDYINKQFLSLFYTKEGGLNNHIYRQSLKNSED